VGLYWQEYHAHPVFARGGQGKTQPGALGFEESVGYLDQNSSAITCSGIAAAGASVCQVEQDFDPFDNNVVAFCPGNIRNKSYPASVVLVTRIVEALRCRQTSGW